MPPSVDLEKPKRPAVGGTRRLKRLDGSVLASYTLRAMDTLTAQDVVDRLIALGIDDLEEG